jgi:electron transfer flavoprotein alpha subunit
MSTILVLAEHDEGRFKKTAFELLGKGAALASELGWTLTAAVIGDAPAAELGAFGVQKVFQVAGDFSNYSGTRTAAALESIIQASGATSVIATCAYTGKDALPRVVARLNGGQASDCTDLVTDGGSIAGIRPMYAGKCFVKATIARSPAFFTVRPNSFGQPSPTGGTAEVVTVSADIPASPITVVERKQPDSSVVDLTEAERIVSGGRSLKSAENFDAVIRPLAASIGAAAGASRAAVDAGYAGHGDQVGQTGKTVNPVLYIACGISGAIQHLAGMRTSKVIVAINKDPDAPIFEHATYGIVDDLFEVCPLLQAELDAALTQ